MIHCCMSWSCSHLTMVVPISFNEKPFSGALLFPNPGRSGQMILNWSANCSLRPFQIIFDSQKPCRQTIGNPAPFSKKLIWCTLLFFQCYFLKLQHSCFDICHIHATLLVQLLRFTVFYHLIGYAQTYDLCSVSVVRHKLQHC
jgi:hypothetical protein